MSDDAKGGRRVLYISYTGALEPLGQSQVLQYLKELGHKHEIVLLSFERAEDWGRIEIREAARSDLRAAGIGWVALRYHRGAVLTAVDVITGLLAALYLCFRYRIELIHARSYIPGLIALFVKRTLRIPFIFDMRGFWPDERVDGGIWNPGSRMYRIAKKVERALLLQADVVVSLTRAAVDAMRRFPYLAGRSVRFEVVPTCTNLKSFQCSERGTGSRDGALFRLGYVGSAGTWYEFDAVLDAFEILSRIRPGAELLVINRNDHEYIRARLAARAFVNKVELRATEHSEVPREMSRMDAGVFFYRQTYSKLATAPTKLGEFLACGVPCLSNVGVGDVAGLLEDESVGVAVRDFTEPALEEAVERILRLALDPEIHERCVATARKHFALATGVRAYHDMYCSMP